MVLMADLVDFIDWERESYPTYQDYIFIPFIALFFFCTRFFLDRFVLEKIALRVGVEGKRTTIRKFKEQAWNCIYHGSAEILALYVMHNEPWFTSTKNFWVGPGTQVWPDQKMKLKLKGLYMCGAGFYLSSMFTLISWDTRRSDFVVLMGHHVATFLLIVLSYMLRFARVGAVVLALHDLGDVFLAMGKVIHYTGAEQIAQPVFMFLFVPSWIFTRLLCYPFGIIWSTSYEVIQILMLKERHPVVGPIVYYGLNSLLFCLLVMHIYWSVVIVRMARNMQQTGEIGHDVRSDSESEDEHED